LGGGGNPFLNIVVITQVERDEGAKVLEVAAKGDMSISNLDRLRRIELVV
jgi:hypothetical protein